MKTLIYAQFEPDLSQADCQLVTDLETLRNYLRGKLPDDELRRLNAILAQPFSERNYLAALEAIEAGIAYLSQYDGHELRPDQRLEAAIRASCQEQRALALSVRERLAAACGPLWREPVPPAGIEPASTA